jgi:hypothetical protein
MKDGIGREMTGQFFLRFRLPRKSQGFFTYRKSAIWDRRLYLPSEGRHAVDFFARTNPTASAGFEPAILGIWERSYRVHAILTSVLDKNERFASSHTLSKSPGTPFQYGIVWSQVYNTEPHKMLQNVIKKFIYNNNVNYTCIHMGWTQGLDVSILHYGGMACLNLAA